MNFYTLLGVYEGVEIINNETKINDFEAIVDALVGLAISEEDAREIKYYFQIDKSYKNKD